MGTGTLTPIFTYTGKNKNGPGKEGKTEELASRMKKGEKRDRRTRL